MNTNPDAKRILFYGDSLTWGRIANESDRFAVDTRYTGVLQKELGKGYEVIEEGLRSRMAKGINPYVSDRDGFVQFPAILTSHLPLDILIIFLGTNDTNTKANKTPEQITSDLESYLPVIRQVTTDMGMKIPNKIIFIAPPEIDSSALKENSMFVNASSKSKLLPKFIADMSAKNNVGFFDASKIVVPSKIDGVHLDADNNILLGKALALHITHF